MNSETVAACTSLHRPKTDGGPVLWLEADTPPSLTRKFSPTDNHSQRKTYFSSRESHWVQTTLKGRPQAQQLNCQHETETNSRVGFFELGVVFVVVCLIMLWSLQPPPLYMSCLYSRVPDFVTCGISVCVNVSLSICFLHFSFDYVWFLFFYWFVFILFIFSLLPFLFFLRPVFNNESKSVDQIGTKTVEEGKTIARIYCMKKSIFNKIKRLY